MLTTRIYNRHTLSPSIRSLIRRLLGLALCLALAWFYVAAAAEHGRRVNGSKARGDQSGYLMDAQNVYWNTHGRVPKAMVGERNRMPIYAGYLSLFYDPSMSDPEYFEVGKTANIYLSLGLLVLLGIVVLRHLPLLPAMNLLGVATFGWFIFKAAYTQSELLFYTFFFLAFLACWHALRSPLRPRLVGILALAGLLLALAYLTKAAVPPFIAIFGVMFTAQTLLAPRLPDNAATSRRTALTWAAAAALTFIVVFLATLSPYLSTNKRAFGRYFYNVNSNFYVWYDDWASASVGTRLHDDNLHWPTLPASEMPSAGRYWREHSFAQIAARIQAGLEDIAIVSYRTYDYLRYTVLYGGLLAVLMLTRWRLFTAMMRDHVWLTLFLAAYAVAYILATAFYFPISGTGTGRFFIAHLLPFFFVLTHVFSRSRLRDVEWTTGGVTLGVRHFPVLVLVVLALDVTFNTWDRLMTTYGGF